MTDLIENRMVIDSEWNEIEYGVQDKARLKREQKAYDEAEKENSYELEG